MKNIMTYFEQTPYTFWQNIFPWILKKEFLSVIDSFKPDYVFYMGVLKNKVTMDMCIKYKINYSYLPLTTEYYCVKDFAALENGPCFQCIIAPILSPLKNSCLGSRKNFLKYAKEIIFSLKSKPRLLKANKVIGYSENQLSYLELFGVDRARMLKMPIFFDPKTIDGIVPEQGDYFVMAGQNITAKGWHVLPSVIKKGRNIKYKFIMRDESQAQEFIEKNDLTSYLQDGSIEVLLYLKTHREVLDVVAKSRGVIVPSLYATTGEFYLLEALGLGKPVVVFDAGIHSDVFKNKKNGMISPVGDFDGFYKNIQQVNDDDNLYKILSNGAKDLFDELLSFKIFHRVLSVYFH
jgi:glycosyltransferase involved in cell wall biosynthesis